MAHAIKKTHRPRCYTLHYTHILYTTHKQKNLRMNTTSNTNLIEPTTVIDPAVRSRLTAIAATLEVTALQNQLPHLIALAQELKQIANTTTKD